MIRSIPPGTRSTRDKGDQDGPEGQNQELHHVGPDHCSHPSQGGVGGGHQAHDNDRAPEVEAGDG